MISYGSTFTGILGLDRAFEHVLGAECRWACEKSAFCREIIWREHPELTIHRDIRHISGPASDVEPVDAIIGGFPCPGFSDAGPRTGLEHAESSLWNELASLLDELRPSIVFLENVRGFVRRGLAAVAGDLARIGFDAEWTCLRAADVGAPHRRERWFLLGWRADGRERLADAYGERLRQLAERNLRGQAFGRDPPSLDAGADDMGNTDVLGRARGDGGAAGPSERRDALRAGGMADTAVERRGSEDAGRSATAWRRQSEPSDGGVDVADRMHDGRSELGPRDDHDRRDASGDLADRRDALELLDHRWPPGPADQEGWARWDGARPSFRRSPDGLPGWVDRSRLAEGLRRARLRALGNAVVSQQAVHALQILIPRALCG